MTADGDLRATPPLSVNALRPCGYCGRLTRAMTRACPAHADLPALDPLHPFFWLHPRPVPKEDS